MSSFSSALGRLPSWVPPSLIGLLIAISSLIVVYQQNTVMRTSLASLHDKNVAAANELISLQKRTSELESELLAAKMRIVTLGEQRIPSEEVSLSLVTIGVEWNDSPGDRSHVWYGTGFGIANSEWFATAAHVIQQAQREQSSLEKRGVPSRIVIRDSDSAISELTRSEIHPQFRVTNRNTEEPSYDIALFLTESQRPTTRLPLSEKIIPEIGDEVFVAGFPQSVPQIRYPSLLDAPFLPTVRCGRVERLIDIDDLTKASRRDLLQLDIPMVGGFSGSPVLDFEGRVVGIAVFATHRHIGVREADEAKPTFGGTTRLLDPAHVSFAVSAKLLRQMIEDLRVESDRK